MVKIGFFEKDITPPFGVSIPGYFNLRLGSGIKDNLHAKAVAFEANGFTSAVVTIDSCFVTEETSKAIASRVNKFTGIPESNILVSATHTHTGGPAFASTNKDADAELDIFYIKNMRLLAADAIICAYQRLKPCTLKYAQGSVKGISFIRNYLMKDGSFKTNPGRKNPNIVAPIGEIDDTLSIVLAYDESGKIAGSITNFACHQDCVDGTEFSGDYASVFSSELKKEFGKDFVNVFLLGACGNINHFNVKEANEEPDIYKRMGRIVAKEFMSAIKNAKEISADDVKCEKKIYTFVQRVPNEEELAHAKQIASSVVVPEGTKLAADSPQEIFDWIMACELISFTENATHYIDIPLQVIKVGEMFIYGMPGENFVQLGNIIKEKSPSKYTFIATLSNGNFGYIPTKDSYKPGLYESLYRSAKVDPGKGEYMAEQLVDIAKNL